MGSLLQEAYGKMDPKSYNQLFDQILIRPIGLPREVQVKVEEHRLRTNIKTLQDSIVQFDIKNKIAGSENTAAQSEEKRIPADTGTFLPNRATSANNGDEQRGTLNSLLRYPEDMTQWPDSDARQDQDNMQSMAKDIRELKNSFVELNTKTMPVLLKQIIDELGTMNATNKELIEHLKQKSPVQSPRSNPPMGHGAGPETRVENSRGPFRFSSGQSGPILGVASGAPPSGFAVGLSKPKSPKNYQTVTLEDQPQNDQGEPNFWENLHSDTSLSVRKLPGVKDNVPQAHSKDNGFKRHENEPELPTSQFVGNSFIGFGQAEIKAADHSSGEQFSPPLITRPVKPGPRRASATAPSTSSSGFFSGSNHQSDIRPPAVPLFGNTGKPASGGLFGTGDDAKHPGEGFFSSLEKHERGGLFGNLGKPVPGGLHAVAPPGPDPFTFGGSGKPAPGSLFAQPAPGSGLFTVPRQSDGTVMPGYVLGDGEQPSPDLSFIFVGGNSTTSSRPHGPVPSLFGRRGKQATDGWKGIPPMFLPSYFHSSCSAAGQLQRAPPSQPVSRPRSSRGRARGLRWQRGRVVRIRCQNKRISILREWHELSL